MPYPFSNYRLSTRGRIAPVKDGAGYAVQFYDWKSFQWVDVAGAGDEAEAERQRKELSAQLKANGGFLHPQPAG